MFKFSLEPLLTHRRNEEEALQRELAQLLEALGREEQRLVDLRTTQSRWETELRQRQQTGMRQVEYALCCDYINRLKLEMDRQRQSIKDAKVRHEAKRLELVEAAKRRKTLEKLRDNRFDTYRRETQRKELEQLNEAAVSRYIRQTMDNTP